MRPLDRPRRETVTLFRYRVIASSRMRLPPDTHVRELGTERLSAVGSGTRGDSQEGSLPGSRGHAALRDPPYVSQVPDDRNTIGGVGGIPACG